MKSAALQIAILAALLGAPIAGASAHPASGADALGTAAFRGALPARTPLALRKSDDPTGQEPATGILDDASPGWEEESDDFEGFAAASHPSFPSPASARLALAPAGVPRSTFSPPTRSSLLRC